MAAKKKNATKKPAKKKPATKKKASKKKAARKPSNPLKVAVSVKRADEAEGVTIWEVTLAGATGSTKLGKVAARNASDALKRAKRYAKASI